MIPVIQKLNTLRIITVPMVTKGGFIPNFKVYCKGCLFYEYNKDEDKKPEFIRDRSQVDLEITKECLVYDDVKVEFYSGKKKIFHFLFHTWFIDATSSGSGILYLNKNMIDKAHGDKKEKIFDKNFAIKLFMTRVDAEYKYESKACKPINVHMPNS
jgi:hypothetical protein